MSPTSLLSLTGLLLSGSLHAAQRVDISTSAELAISKSDLGSALLGQRLATVPLANIDANTTHITVPIDGLGQLVLERRSMARGLDGVLTWRGRGADGLNQFEAVFAFGSQHAFGVVHGPHRQWRLGSGPEGEMVWQTIDPLKLQRASDADVLLPMAQPTHSNKGGELEPPGGGSTDSVQVDVLVAVDAQLIASYPEAVARAEFEVSYANSMFVDSQAAVQLRLVGVQLLADVPQLSTPEQLLALKTSNDGAMDTVHRVRDGLGADIVVLVSRSSGPVCGVAASLMPSADQAFATINGASQCDDRLFAHEVGHLFSAEHDPETANNPGFPTTSTKPYARGFKRNLPGKNAPLSYATIMTYNGSTSCIVGYDFGGPRYGLCQPARFFSNPQVLDEFGFATGTPLQDNVRAIREEAARVASFRSPPLPTHSLQTGSWHNPDRTGHGLLISRAQQDLIGTWYTYLADGTPTWYFTSVAPIIGGQWEATLFRTQRDPSSGVVSVITTGDVKLRPLTAHRAVFEWDFHDVGGNGSTPDGAEYMEFLFGGGSYEGQWFQPADNGWGMNISQSGSVSLGAVFYYHGSQPAWVVSAPPVSGLPIGYQSYPLVRYTSSGLCPSCFDQPRSRVEQPAGLMYLNLIPNTPTAIVGIQTADGHSWLRGTWSEPAAMARLTLP